jgi:hypothetical protein
MNNIVVHKTEKAGNILTIPVRRSKYAFFCLVSLLFLTYILLDLSINFEDFELGS